MGEPTHPGTVYAIEGGGLIKIGWTGGAVERRMAEIQRMSGSKLSVVTTWEGSREFERRLHRVFREYRRHGEWFAMPAGWRALADAELGIVDEPILDPDEQIEMAESLLDEIAMCCDPGEVTVSVILDSLGTAGLRLARDTSGIAGSAWVVEIVGE